MKNQLLKRIEILENRISNDAPIMFFDLVENNSNEFDTGLKASLNEDGKLEYFEGGKPISEKSLDGKIVFIDDIKF
jgi:hypothetical protein